VSLIVGICCTDGLVLGADDAANFGTVSHPTIRTAYKKIRIVSDVAAISVASTTGVLQQYEDVLASNLAGDTLRAIRPVQAMNRLRDGFVETANVQFQVATLIQHEAGTRAWESCVAEVLVATEVAGAYRLYHFDAHLAPQEVTPELPFIAIGSGRLTADPFIAHLRRIYYPERNPDLALGVMTAAWVLKHAEETGAPGVGKGRQIVTLQGYGETRRVQQLTREQLQEAYEFIDRTEESMRSVSRLIQEPSVFDLPEAPTENGDQNIA